MKNKNVLKNTLYGLSLISLVYTGYTLFYSYNSVTQYYSAYGQSAPLVDIVHNLLSNAFTPFILAIVLFSLAEIIQMVYGIRQEFEVVADEEEKKEVVQEDSLKKPTPKAEESNPEEKVITQEEEPVKEDREEKASEKIDETSAETSESEKSSE